MIDHWATSRAMSPDVIQQCFAKLYGVPSWHVRQGYGSFLTFEFGAPCKEIEPVINREPKHEDSRPPKNATIHGDWHLWIYCCGWRITQNGRALATFESSRESIAAACGTLNGQALSGITFQPERGGSVFTFDAGGKLTTSPFDDDLLEQWMLYCPDSYVLTYRSDGAFSHVRGDGAPDDFSTIDAA
jgi:hypothetical protein